ncbi:hypothetical protein [Actinomadura chibensis]|uniref:Uncharacterized protein n=1 Tax=Actinomadura chibensis TaxID=392828 RepID=A0A5D0NKI8_9ACTN|nr:hypothetical protein [Actinomadura chibensis]TYB45000.1 hypothetical protein FXF69_23030 [Actinomadura chibensis]
MHKNGLGTALTGDLGDLPPDRTARSVNSPPGSPARPARAPPDPDVTSNSTTPGSTPTGAGFHTEEETIAVYADDTSVDTVLARLSDVHLVQFGPGWASRGCPNRPPQMPAR